MALKVTASTIAEFVFLALLVAACASSRFLLSKKADNISLGPGCALPSECAGACKKSGNDGQCDTDSADVCTCWCPSCL